VYHIIKLGIGTNILSGKTKLLQNYSQNPIQTVLKMKMCKFVTKHYTHAHSCSIGTQIKICTGTSIRNGFDKFQKKKNSNTPKKNRKREKLGSQRDTPAAAHVRTWFEMITAI